jgi:hypothetical protein
MLYTLSFVNDGNRIDARAYRIFTADGEIEKDKLEEKYTTIINRSLNEDHTRASFEKMPVGVQPEFFYDR